MAHGLASRRTACARRLGLLLSLCVPLLAASLATAQSDIDLEVAKRRFAAGASAYQRGEYQAALAEFLAASQIHDVPALRFNIGRCLDRLGRWKEAADAYEKYLDNDHNAPDAAELRARIVVLRQRDATTTKPIETTDPPPRPTTTPTPTTTVVTTPATVPSTSTRPRRLLLAASITGGVALALGAAGGGVYGNLYADFAARRDACDGACDPASYDGLRDRVHRGQIVSGVLFGLGGAALVSDVVLWTLWSRARRSP